MSELLDLAVKAHGGLDRWNKVKSIKVGLDHRRDLVPEGEAGRPQECDRDSRNQRGTGLTMAFVGQDKRSTFEPNRVVIETSDGTLIEARDNPEASFDGQQLEHAVG